VTGFSFDGITFMSDEYHYFIDVAKEQNKNRISLFKDGSGYLTFRTYDKDSNNYSIKRRHFFLETNEPHHVAIGWKLNSIDSRDEMHLFVDGFEVPNIIKYGGRPESVITDRFRTIKPEFLSGTLSSNIFTNNDLIINNDNIVYSNSTDFDYVGIAPGDQLEILEFGLGNIYNNICIRQLFNNIIFNTIICF
jgi:hypothetical protein